MGKKLDILEASLGGHVAANTSAVEMRYILEEMKRNQLQHYQYQDEQARQQTALLAEIRDLLLRGN